MEDLLIRAHGSPHQDHNHKLRHLLDPVKLAHLKNQHLIEMNLYGVQDLKHLMVNHHQLEDDQNQYLIEMNLYGESTFKTVHWAPVGALFCVYNMRVQMTPLHHVLFL